MKSIFALSGLFLVTAALQAQRVYHDWEDPAMLQQHRLPARASFVPYVHEAGDSYLSLEGEWQFHWSPAPDGRIEGFEQEGFQPSTGDWSPLSVPSTWEVNGYGTPIYVSAGYSFRVDPPYVTSEPKQDWTTYVERNPTGQYRRTVDIPSAWLTDGGRTLLRTEGVASAFYVWVNGQKVGYSQGAQEPAEFDITDALNSARCTMHDARLDETDDTGDNRASCIVNREPATIALEVYKYSDGAYLEDQDFWRLAGVYRPLYLIHTPALRIEDVTIRTLDRSVKGGEVSYRLQVDPELVWSDNDGTMQSYQRGLEAVRGCLLKARLTDTEGNEVTSMQCPADEVLDLEHKAALMNNWFPQRGPRKTGRMETEVSGVSEWTAETPTLYTLTLALTDSEGNVRQQLQQHVGFREIQLRHGRFLVNGNPIKLRGVNRHEHDPRLGRVMTEERMLQDILLMKRAGVNAIRTSHYPNHPRWYELCDSLGIYVMDEAGIETHGLRGTLASTPAWHAAMMDRAVRMAERDKNHPSVIIWSMGNESGFGPNFAAISAWLHDFDTTRPVHHEGAQGYIMPTSQADQHEVIVQPDPASVDIISRFYPRVQADYLNPGMAEGADQERAENARWERLLGIAQRTDTFHEGLLQGIVDERPILTSEYSHAMGNAIGNLSRYWQEIYSHPRMLGGFIWDWVDQGFYADAGCTMHNARLNGTDVEGNNRASGIMNREPHKMLYGGAFGDKPNSGAFCMNGIIFADRTYGEKYKVVKQVYAPVQIIDGSIYNRQCHSDLSNYVLYAQLVEDGKPRGKRVAVTIPDVQPGEKAKLDLPALHSQKDAYLNLSITLRNATPWAEAGYEVYHQQIALNQNRQGIVNAETPRNDKVHTADSLLQLLCAGSRLQVWRAPTDNDKMFGNWLAKEWQKQQLDAPVRTTSEPQNLRTSEPQNLKTSEPQNLTQTDRYQYANGCIIVTSEWTVNDDGSIGLTQTYRPEGQLPDLARLGIELRLPKALNQLTWYGMGPGETFPDRLESAEMGLWHSTVEEQYTHYPKPQDGGSHQGTALLKLLDLKGHGLVVTIPVDSNAGDGTGFTFQALPYTAEELNAKKYDYELSPADAVILNLDCAQLGIGNSSCGPGVLKEFAIDPALGYTLRLRFMWQ